MQHLKKFCFVWEYLALHFRYSTELSKDRTKLIGKIDHGEIHKKKIISG